MESQESHAHAPRPPHTQNGCGEGLLTCMLLAWEPQADYIGIQGNIFNSCGHLVSQAIRIFPRGAHARGGRRNGKNTSGNMCQVFVPSAGMLAEPIKFERS